MAYEITVEGLSLSYIVITRPSMFFPHACNRLSDIFCLSWCPNVVSVIPSNLAAAAFASIGDNFHSFSMLGVCFHLLVEFMFTFFFVNIVFLFTWFDIIFVVLSFSVPFGPSQLLGELFLGFGTALLSLRTVIS
eukprot:PhM_4_TR8419/c4_g2_i1/m.8254